MVVLKMLYLKVDLAQHRHPALFQTLQVRIKPRAMKLISGKVTQNILNAGVHFREGILHYGKPETI